MKILIFTTLIVASLYGCAGMPGASNPADPGPLAKFTHADLTTAAVYATQNGYPARAAVYTALDTQLTACEAAIAESGPTALPVGKIGVFTAYEVAAETVGNGIPIKVRMNCGAIVLP